MATQVTIPELIRIIEAKVRDGIDGMARFGKEQYRKDVIKQTSPFHPLGRPPPEKPFDDPPSSPGEFPERETGQGEDNVDWERGKRTGMISAAYGLRGPETGYGPYPPTHEVAGGLHLYYLTFQKRQGPDDSLFNNLQKFRRVFKNIVHSGRTSSVKS